MRRRLAPGLWQYYSLESGHEQPTVVIAPFGGGNAYSMADGGHTDLWVTEAHLLAWAQFTQSYFKAVLLHGGHFYYRENLQGVCHAINTALSENDNRRKITDEK
ncbi:hypothetical protein ACSLVK_02745 [Photorhabdus tasmaniensis]|uniref:Uncharacterized protein n=2 Tax=Photorhabdus temperata TaxID=574560 RepID=A0A081RZ76_PHOTE|nr:hypothetical protein [Photorhabdus temperata]EQC00387.1 hypothetical protein B738_11525 [Photorhabdus temperata subsp. temperata M1021]ERT11921.1 hypothetical protein O185_16945 [Photorhabdus temperata J3]KER03979.1 hypothetical protein MEG1DRAFT_01259 [Photorhabdus temperata subsp. temperata Meg1]MCT8347111.1 hypothetical protein [Photorhabdus temperata]